MARKCIPIVTLFLILLILGGCAKDVTPKTNVTAPKTLTEDQQEIVDLLSLSNKQEIILFTYQADAEYKDFEVWVEIYKDGELVDPHAGGIGMMNDIDNFQGDLAIVITQDPDFKWSFIVQEGGTKASHMSDPNTNYDTSLGRAYGPATVPVEIEDSKEILLYSCIFFENSCRTFDMQELEDNPDLLKKYPYVHLIKCRFSK